MYSSKASSNLNHGLPIVFNNPDKDKLKILDEVGKKPGIYMWTNKIDNKSYIGSSVNLKRRLLEYFNANRLLREKSMVINIALLKHGYSNFTLTVLEYCDVSDLMSREKYYFDVYSPEYNILKTPGSPSRGSGWKHSEATIEKMSVSALNRSNASLSLANPNASGVKVTDIETNKVTYYHAIRAAARDLGIDKRYIEHYIYIDSQKPVLAKYTFELLDYNKMKNLNVQKTSKRLEVRDIKTNIVTEYDSIGAAARDLNLRQPSISLYIKDGRIKPFKGRYIFKLI